MGYDYIIRVAVNYKDGTYRHDLHYDAQQLFEVYRRLKFNGQFYIHFATDGHGGSSSMSCGVQDEHFEELFKFTSRFPDITFTFYVHYFDFTGIQILVVKDRQVVSNYDIDVEDEEQVDREQLKKYGLEFVENVATEVRNVDEDEDEDEAEGGEGGGEDDDEGDDEDDKDDEKETKSEAKGTEHQPQKIFLTSDPRNIRIHNEISRIFYDERFALVGGLCFGPTLKVSIGQWLFGFPK